jgi:repressor LexA
MTTIGERLTALREKQSLTQAQVAEIIGVDRTSYAKYETNVNKPTRKLKELSDLFNVSSDYIMCLTDLPDKLNQSLTPHKGALREAMDKLDESQIVTIHHSYRVPILGRVAAGNPIYADEEVIGYTYIDEEYKGDGFEYFALIIKGQSMEPTIMDGDTVIVRKQDYIESGQIAIVLIDGEDATAKEVKETPEGVVLIGHNAAVYQPHFYSRQEIQELPVQIIGRVVQSIRKF